MRLLIATLVSAAVVLSAPFMGQVRAAMLVLSREQFIWVMGGAVGGAIAAAIAFAYLRIREQRAMRLTTIGLALALGFAYTTAMTSGYAEVDAVERVHFVEYGLIAFLFYRVWRDAGDPSMVILPLLCAFVVGTLDEWLQWFIPVRVGEVRDVFLNLVAIGCGLMFAAAVESPPHFSWRMRPGSAMRIGLAASVTLLIVAAFYSAIHLGHVVYAEGIGRFKSRHTAGELESRMADRAERWRTDPPVVLRRLSREDQYLDEGLWHVRSRNNHWDDGEMGRSWAENLILERFFAPVLDHPSYASPGGHRWSAEQRADAEKRAGRPDPSFMSDAEPYPIATWPKSWFWFATMVLAVSTAATSVYFERRAM